AEAVESRSLLVVALGRERYGLPVEHIREIRPLGTLARVPGVADRWLGLTNARGQLVAVLDLARHLGLDGGAGDDPHLVLVEAHGFVGGLAVQGVAELSTVAVADIGRCSHRGRGRRSSVSRRTWSRSSTCRRSSPTPRWSCATPGSSGGRRRSHGPHAGA